MSSDAGRVATTVPFLWGTFKTFPLADIFGVLALSRQFVRLRFSDEEKEVGAIAVKAGQVIGAEDFRTQARGADALKGLITDPGTAFAVVKLPGSALETQATAVIGRLAELLPKTGRGPGTVEGSVEEAPIAEPIPVEAYDSVSIEDILDAAETQVAAPIGEPGGRRPEPGGGPESAPIQPSSPSAPSSHAGEVILRGDVSDVSFDEILGVLQLNQQHLLISFIRGGSQIGTLNLMSEQVLAAGAGSLRGIEAFRLLYADHGETFEVRRLAAPDPTETLGAVSELLADARQAHLPSPTSLSSTAEGERSLFMEGRLSDFSLELLLSSLDLCRQPIELVLRRKENILHRVLIKSGRITAAASASGEGADAALAAIREDPGVEFLVYRYQGLVDGSPVAPLRALVSETDEVPRPAEAEGGRLSSIEARLEQMAADMAALRVALSIPKQDAAQAEPAKASSPFAAAEAELRLGQEHTRARGAMRELRTVLADLRA